MVGMQHWPYSLYLSISAKSDKRLLYSDPSNAPYYLPHWRGCVRKIWSTSPDSTWTHLSPDLGTNSRNWGIGISTGIGLGTTAYIQGQGIAQLQAAITQDLQTLENSISLLEQSLTSLSEVVLQNRRGLDLLFIKDGGLCAALGEECCFYSDHSGVIKDSMAKLRESLCNRQNDYKAQQGWFEGWFNRSPWLTTLVSTLLGPIIIILLLLTFGPCIINRLTQFVKERLSVVHALVLSNIMLWNKRRTQVSDHGYKIITRLKRKREECETPT